MDLQKAEDRSTKETEARRWYVTNRRGKTGKPKHVGLGQRERLPRSGFYDLSRRGNVKKLSF